MQNSDKTTKNRPERRFYINSRRFASRKSHPLNDERYLGENSHENQRDSGKSHSKA